MKVWFIRELEAFTKFGSDLDENTTRVIEHGKRLMEILKQEANKPLTMAEEAIILYAINNKFLVDVEVEDVKKFELGLYKYLNTKHADVVKLMNKELKLTDEVAKKLEAMLLEYKKSEF